MFRSTSSYVTTLFVSQGKTDPYIEHVKGQSCFFLLPSFSSALYLPCLFFVFHLLLYPFLPLSSKAWIRHTLFQVLNRGSQGWNLIIPSFLYSQGREQGFSRGHLSGSKSWSTFICLSFSMMNWKGTLEIELITWAPQCRSYSWAGWI